MSDASDSDSSAWSNDESPSAAKSQRERAASDAYEYVACDNTEIDSEDDAELARCDLVALGAANVGKTTLLLRLSERRFEKERNKTIGVDRVIMNVYTNHPKYDRRSKAVWFDTAGQERFGSVRIASTRTCQGAMIVFDSTVPQTFDTAKQYCAEFLAIKPTAQCVLVANKIDLYKAGKDASGAPVGKWMENRDFSAEALKMGCKVGFFCCSALDGAEVDNAAVRLIDFTLNKMERTNAELTLAEKAASGGNGVIKLTRSSQINNTNQKNTTIKCCSK